MGLARSLLIKAISLFAVLMIVMGIIVVILGVSGYSDRLLNAIVTQQTNTFALSLPEGTLPEARAQMIADYETTLTEAYGLNVPWWGRLPSMVWRVLSLDLGEARTAQSYAGSKNINAIILERLPNTILLITSAIVISVIIGLFVGIKAATVPGSILDRVTSYFSAVSYAMPTWWIGIIFILVLAVMLRWFPTGLMYSAPPPEDPLMRFLDVLWHAALPIGALTLGLSGIYIYQTRTVVLNTAQEDFVSVARAKGLPENIVRRRYVLRVAAPPLLTNVILGLAGSISGAILTETVFRWPGMGLLYYNAIFTADEGIIVGLTFMFTLVYVVARFVLEVLYVALDPRVRY